MCITNQTPLASVLNVEITWPRDDHDERSERLDFCHASSSIGEEDVPND